MMRVYLAEGLFESTSVDPLDIIELIKQASSGRHHVLLRPAFGVADDKHHPRDTWLEQRDPKVRQRLTELLRVSAREASTSNPGVPHVTVVDSSSSDWTAGRLAIPDALRLLKAPLRLLLENERNDWKFLLALVRGPYRRALQRARDEQWLEVDNGGGLDEIKQRLDELVAPATEGAAWHAQRLRTWVMFDRDAHEEDPRRTSRRSDAVAQLCAHPRLQGPWPFPYMQLRRRSIESYLPLEALSDRAVASNGLDRIASLRALRDQHPAEAFAYSMKEGFIKDASSIEKRQRGELRKRWQAATSEAERRALVPTKDLPAAWRALDEDLLADLLFGFGRDVADAFSQCNTRPRWDEYLQQEYERGPSGQPSRDEIASRILELI